MLEPAFLLDTPKKASLQSQSTHLRLALKEFERTFASSNNGRKPSKDDIKADGTIAAKYKAYSRVRDVLDGKLSYEVFIAPQKLSPGKKRHERVDSGFSRSSQRVDVNITPRKRAHPSQVDSYDVPPSTTPKAVFMTAIGPTPQRDGRVMGLFDLLSNSARSSRSTLSGCKKRRLDDAVAQSPDLGRGMAVAQTPSQKRSKKANDLLDHLTAAYGNTPETGRRRQGRTPVSDGKKFMLSQFFATPSAARYRASEEDLANVHKTPLCDHVLGRTSENEIRSEPALDTTPAYLKRSMSFKDRLLGASSPVATAGNDGMNVAVSRRGPPTLRHFRSVARSSSQSMIETRSEDNCDDSEHDDDLDALRELEDVDTNRRVRDIWSPDQILDRLDRDDSSKEDLQPTKIWKKKGQKRSTKRAKIRPAFAKLADAPKFVAAEDEDNEHGNTIPEATKTRLREDTSADNRNDDEGATFIEHVDAEGTETEGEDLKLHKQRKLTGSIPKKSIKLRDDKSKDRGKGTDGKKAGTINPNAQSHMNFRSLKIRNKNSRAKGAGRGRFGRR